MKNIILFVLSLSLFACEKYEQPSLLTLSGTYRIIKIETVSSNISISIAGLDTFVNDDGINVDTVWKPLNSLDTIFLGRTLWMLDELKIYMLPVFDVNISNQPILWNSISYYTTFGQTYYTSGYLQFTHISGKTIRFKILEDGEESIVFEEQRNNGYVRYYLDRIGP
jgi:hypothetical protein